jgi:hypothetical protein
MKAMFGVVGLKSTPDKLSEALIVVVTTWEPSDVLKSGGLKLSPVNRGGVVSDGEELTESVGLIPALINWAVLSEMTLVAESRKVTCWICQAPLGLYWGIRFTACHVPLVGVPATR